MSIYKKLELDKITKDNFETYDIFICSSSFEERSTKIPYAIKGLGIKKWFICHYSSNYEISETNLNTINSYNEDSIIIKFEKDSPAINLDVIVHSIQLYKQKNRLSQCRILVDISSFTHEMLLILTYLFKKYLIKPDYSVMFAYTEAIDYSINELFEEKWLSKGVGEIRSVLGFGGEIMPNKKNALIILVGYEEERVKSIIDLYEPNKVLLGHASAKGAINNELRDKNINTFEHLFNSLNVENEIFEFSCITPEETTSAIDKLIESLSDYNIIIAALNNKISTIGCAISAIKHPHVQICYPTAIAYNINGYSEAGNIIHLIGI